MAINLFVQGNYIYLVDKSSLRIFGLSSGNAIYGLEVGSISASGLQVENYAHFDNYVDIKGGLSVGKSVNIGDNTSIDGQLEVSGDVYASEMLLTSDARYKKNITQLTDALDIVLKLRGVRHQWKATAGKRFSEGVVLGLIAQEVEPYLPEVVRTDQNGFKSVDYTKLTPLLIEAIKSQQQQLDNQEKRLQAIEEKLSMK